MRNASKPRPVAWKKMSWEQHNNDMVPVILIAPGEPSRDRYDFEYHLPEQIRDYLAGYTDIDPATVDMDALVTEILDDQITRPYGQGISLYRKLLLHYVERGGSPDRARAARRLRPGTSEHRDQDRPGEAAAVAGSPGALGDEVVRRGDPRAVPPDDGRRRGHRPHLPRRQRGP
jgi:hypothetical protein